MASRSARTASWNALPAILIGDDGKVKRLLHGETLKLSGDTKVIDAGGRTVLPGLIDAHGHVMGLGFGALQLDLVGTTSLAELQQRLRAYAAANPGSGWIIGRGWNQENWAGKRFPTSADLDAVVSDRPVWLERVDGHASVGNSAALKAAGITAATVRRRAGGSRTACSSTPRPSWSSSKIPAPDAATYDAALAKAQELMLSNGLTAAADMGTSAADWAAMNRAGRATHAQRADHELCRGHSGDARDQRRPPDRGSVRRPAPSRSGSNYTPTARSARAGRGSRRPITTCPRRAG